MEVLPRSYQIAIHDHWTHDKSYRNDCVQFMARELGFKIGTNPEWSVLKAQLEPISPLDLVLLPQLISCLLCAWAQAMRELLILDKHTGTVNIAWVDGLTERLGGRVLPLVFETGPLTGVRWEEHGKRFVLMLAKETDGVIDCIDDWKSIIKCQLTTFFTETESILAENRATEEGEKHEYFPGEPGPIKKEGGEEEQKEQEEEQEGSGHGTSTLLDDEEEVHGDDSEPSRSLGAGPIGVGKDKPSPEAGPVGVGEDKPSLGAGSVAVGKGKPHVEDVKDDSAGADKDGLSLGDDAADVDKDFATRGGGGKLAEAIESTLGAARAMAASAAAMATPITGESTATAVENLPDPDKLPPPKKLLRWPPYHMMILVTQANEIEVMCSHSASLKVLSEYFTKWGQGRPNQNRFGMFLGLTARLIPSLLGPGLADCVVITLREGRDCNSDSSRVTSGPICPLFVLAVAERTLGYKQVGRRDGENMCWMLRRDEPF